MLQKSIICQSNSTFPFSTLNTIVTHPRKLWHTPLTSAPVLPKSHPSLPWRCLAHVSAHPQSSPSGTMWNTGPCVGGYGQNTRETTLAKLMCPETPLSLWLKPTSSECYLCSSSEKTKTSGHRSVFIKYHVIWQLLHTWYYRTLSPEIPSTMCTPANRRLLMRDTCWCGLVIAYITTPACVMVGNAMQNYYSQSSMVYFRMVTWYNLEAASRWHYKFHYVH